MTLSDCSSGLDTSSDRLCAECGDRITTGRRDKRVCSTECRRASDRRRASSWYRDNRHRPSVQESRQEASRRSRERDKHDPARLEKRRRDLAEWRAANRDKCLAQERAWRAANPEAVREKLHRRRARLLGAYVSHVDAEDIWERDGGICQICADPIDRSLQWPHRLSLTHDHIVALADGGTHEPDNVQLAHATCNARKGAAVQRAPQTPPLLPHGRACPATGDPQ
jgi:hypothetical protein